MTATFEVIVLPVSDPDESLRFYRDGAGFDLDVDYSPAPNFRVIQLTPPGSGASIQFGVGLTDAPVGAVAFFPASIRIAPITRVSPTSPIRGGIE
jgi:catechol 2,3-dioxygenase-like lactoylglutathione lyase family enzyme